MYESLTNGESRIMQAIRDLVRSEADNIHTQRQASQRGDLDQLHREVMDLMQKYPDDQDVAHIETLIYRLLY